MYIWGNGATGQWAIVLAASAPREKTKRPCRPSKCIVNVGVETLAG